MSNRCPGVFIGCQRKLTIRDYSGQLKPIPTFNQKVRLPHQNL
jgi:hypothetical protein